MRRVARSWQAFAVVLVVWGNAAAYLAGTAIPVGWTGPLIGTALVVISLAWARGQGLTLDELGLGTSGLGRGAVVGLAFAALRVRTRSLAAPLLAHWAFNGALLSGLRLLG